jgi:hypothetical protein
MLTAIIDRGIQAGLIPSQLSRAPQRYGSVNRHSRYIHYRIPFHLLNTFTSSKLLFNSLYKSKLLSHFIPKYILFNLAKLIAYTPFMVPLPISFR